MTLKSSVCSYVRKCVWHTVSIPIYNFTWDYSLYLVRRQVWRATEDVVARSVTNYIDLYDT
jgi:hypothetical protein